MTCTWHAASHRVFLLGLLCSSGFAVAQTEVSGTVNDVAARPIPFCNVFLERGGIPRQLTSTDEEGKFVLHPDDTGTYRLVATSVGYKKHWQEVLLGPGPVKVDIVLYPDTILLGEVIVRSESPIQTKGDTVVYDATYFAKGDEVVLADLLSKLPGVTVDEKGKVKFRGKDVSKIKVEDDDLFDTNYSLLTRNLSADLVEQVEVLQNYSDNRLLKNLEDSEDIAINLKLKKDRKARLFGDARLETNFDARHESQVNLISFTRKWKGYALSSVNTIGNDPAGDADALMNPSGSTRVLGSDVASDYVVPVSKPYIAEFRRNRYAFNQALFSSLHAIYRPAKKLKLTLQGYGYRDESNFYVATRRDYFTPADTVLFDEFGNTDNVDRFAGFQVIADYDATADRNVRYKFKRDLSEISLFQQNNLNQNDIRERLISEASRQDHHITVTERLSQREALTLDVRYTTDRRPQRYTIGGNLMNAYFGASSPTDTLHQASEMPTRYWGGELNYYRRIMQGKLGFRSGFERLEQTVQSNLTTNRSDLSKNDLGLTERKAYAEGYYAMQVGKIILTPGAGLQHIEISVTDRSIAPYLFFNPRLGLRWKLSDRSRFAAIYSISQPTSSAAQLTRYPVVKGYNLIAVNDTGFRTFPAKTLLISYDLGNWSSGLSLAVTFFHKVLDSDYLVNSNIAPNYVVTTMNTVADKKLSSLTALMDKYFSSARTNLKIDWTFSRSEFVTSIEDVAVPTTSNNHKLDVSLRTALSGPVNVHVGHVLQMSSATNGLIAASNYSSLIYLDGYITGLRSRLNLSVHGERYALMSVEGQPVFHFIDLTARYKLNATGRTLLLLKGRNLLNEDVFGQRIVSNQSITVSTNRLIPRYVMAGIEFRF